LTVSVWLTSVLLAAQAAVCGGAAATRQADGLRAFDVFDLAGAVRHLESAAACPDAQVASWYLKGLAASREASRRGGPEEALRPVREAAAVLERLSKGSRGPAQIAGFVLMAATAAAQSERDEMALYLRHAVDLETVQLGAGQRGAPLLSAHEAAGDLWLQVHRYDDARTAYQRARDAVGPTRRVRLGLARTAARLNDVTAACSEYQALNALLASAPPKPAEIADIDDYIAANCLPRAQPSPKP
jgi:hypothetical protein